MGGKAAAFEYAGKKFPLGAVGTPLALPEASFTEAQLLEKPGRFAASLFRGTGRRLHVLNANNLLVRSFKGGRWPTVFPEAELTSQEPVADWQRAFGASGAPDRFYAHNHDFAPGGTSAGLDRSIDRDVDRVLLAYLLTDLLTYLLTYILTTYQTWLRASRWPSLCLGGGGRTPRGLSSM